MSAPSLVAGPFLGQYLLVQPGKPAGVRIPEARYEELAAVTADDQPAPAWLVDAAAKAWGTGRRLWGLSEQLINVRFAFPAPGQRHDR